MPRIEMIETGKKLKKFRLRANLSVEEVKERLGLNNPTCIYCWEKGLYLPTFEHMMKLTDLYHVSLAEIFVVITA